MTLYPDVSLAIVIWWTLIYDILLQVNVIILSYLTNVIVSSLGEDSNEGCLNQLFLELFSQNDGLFAFCQSYPQVRIFLAHPNIRLQPSWYSRLRPVIIRVMHRFLQTKPPNLQILDDYSGDLEKDGVHYSILSGINFVKSLVDQAMELFRSEAPDPSVKLVLGVLLTLLLIFDPDYALGIIHWIALPPFSK